MRFRRLRRRSCLPGTIQIHDVRSEFRLTDETAVIVRAQWMAIGDRDEGCLQQVGRQAASLVARSGRYQSPEAALAQLTDVVTGGGVGKYRLAAQVRGCVAADVVEVTGDHFCPG